MDMEVDIPVKSDEQYVIYRAKLALENDPISAKAWMITAKTLYPNNFGVQFEAYRIEKSAGHIKEAAKCFTDLIGKFQEQPEFWEEINHVTGALRSENDCTDPDKLFLTKMFKHISLDVQHKLLLLTANHSDDTIEHCKLLLLFLQRFPSAIATHGPGLVETLLSAEKHGHSSNQPVNIYRKLLVCDLLPLLSSENIVGMEMSTKLIYKCLHKTIEYYLCHLSENLPRKERSLNTKSDEHWINLFKIVEFVGKKLGWEAHLTNFTTNWSKDGYWTKLMTFYQAQVHNLEDPNILRQLIYCIMLFLIYCLHQYIICMNTEIVPTQTYCSYLLIDAFTDSSLPNPQVQDAKSMKRRKSDVVESAHPYITTEASSNSNVISNFLMAVSCWDVLNSTEQLNREYLKLSGNLNLDAWISGFLIDYYILKGRHDDALQKLHQTNELQHSPLVKNLLMANILYLKTNYILSFEHILLVMSMLPTNMGTFSNQLVVGGTQRHLHFLPLTNLAILQFCNKILLSSIRENALKQSGYAIAAIRDNTVKTAGYSDLAIGHSLVLMQLNWDQEDVHLPGLIEQINRRGVFQYYLFQAYIIHVDIVEELSYLWSTQGGQITLDILPHLGQRRIGTRGADKGVKEEIRQAMRKQIMRCNEPMHQLIHTFITQERGLISQTLV